jgi:hypothetical protein
MSQRSPGSPGFVGRRYRSPAWNPQPQQQQQQLPPEGISDDAVIDPNPPPAWVAVGRARAADPLRPGATSPVRPWRQGLTTARLTCRVAPRLGEEARGALGEALGDSLLATEEEEVPVERTRLSREEYVPALGFVRLLHAMSPSLRTVMLPVNQSPKADQTTYSQRPTFRPTRQIATYLTTTTTNTNPNDPATSSSRQRTNTDTPPSDRDLYDMPYLATVGRRSTQPLPAGAEPDYEDVEA